MGIELALPILALLGGTTAILTSRFFGDLICTVLQDLRDGFKEAGWFFPFYWQGSASYYKWSIRIAGAGLIILSLFILIWVYLLGHH